MQFRSYSALSVSLFAMIVANSRVARSQTFLVDEAREGGDEGMFKLESDKEVEMVNR